MAVLFAFPSEGCCTLGEGECGIEDEGRAQDPHDKFAGEVDLGDLLGVGDCELQAVIAEVFSTFVALRTTTSSSAFLQTIEGAQFQLIEQLRHPTKNDHSTINSMWWY